MNFKVYSLQKRTKAIKRGVLLVLPERPIREPGPQPQLQAIEGGRMVRDYTSTFGDGARILSALEKDCREHGLPWDSIFGSMGDPQSLMRKAAVTAWNACLFRNRTVLTQGSICYEARNPVVSMSFRQGANWCEKNEEVSLSLFDVSRISGLREALLRLLGDNCRILDLTRLQNGKYHVASIQDLIAARHIQADENFGPDDVIVVRLDPPGCQIKLTYLGTSELPVFEVTTDITIEQLHYQLRCCGCYLARDVDFLNAEYSLPIQSHVIVRGELMFSKYSSYNGEKELKGNVDSDKVIIRAGSYYVIGKPIPGMIRHLS